MEIPLCILELLHVVLLHIIYTYLLYIVEEVEGGDAGKTKIMWFKVSKGQAEDSGEHPCGVCRKGVDDNSILFMECPRWVPNVRWSVRKVEE